MKVRLPRSLLSISSEVKDALIAKKLANEKHISFLVPFHDVSHDVNGCWKRVRWRCGLTGKHSILDKHTLGLPPKLAQCTVLYDGAHQHGALIEDKLSSSTLVPSLGP